MASGAKTASQTSLSLPMTTPQFGVLFRATVPPPAEVRVRAESVQKGKLKTPFDEPKEAEWVARLWEERSATVTRRVQPARGKGFCEAETR